MKVAASRHLLVQIKQWEEQNIMWNLLKVDNSDTKTMVGTNLLSLLLTLNIFQTTFWCFHCRLWTSKCRLGCWNEMKAAVNSFCMTWTNVNPSHATGVFLYPLKIPENLWFSDVFRGYRKTSVTCNGLIFSLDARYRN